MHFLEDAKQIFIDKIGNFCKIIGIDKLCNVVRVLESYKNNVASCIYNIFCEIIYTYVHFKIKIMMQLNENKNEAAVIDCYDTISVG